MKKYKSSSIYNYQQMSEKKFKRQKKLAIFIMEDYIRLSDLFYQTNNFINLDNPEKDNYFKPEEKFSGFNKLFILAGISDPIHKDQFNALTFKKVKELRKTTHTVKEKAQLICDAWLAKAVELGE